MIKSFKNFDEELKSQKIYESADDDTQISSSYDIEVPNLLSNNKFFLKISRIILNKFKKSNVGKFCVHPTIINIDNIDGVYFYKYDDPSINIVICRDVNIKKAYLFKEFDIENNGKYVADVVFSTEKLGFTDIIDEIISRLNTNSIQSISEGILYEWSEGSFNYTEKDVDIVKKFDIRIRQSIINLLKQTNPNSVLKSIKEKTTTQPYDSIYDAIEVAYKKMNDNIIKKVIDIFFKALNYGSEKGTKYTEVLDVLDGCNINGGAALNIQNGGNHNITTPENNVDDNLQLQIAESLKKYELDLKKIKNATRSMCHYVKQNGVLNGKDISAMPMRGLLITGNGGAGKSMTVNKMLEEENMRPNLDYFKTATGSTSPTQLYKYLYDYNRKLLIFDDTSRLFDDEDKISIWKAAFDPDEENNTVALKRTNISNKSTSLGGSVYDPGYCSRQERYFLEVGKSSLEEKTKFYDKKRKEELAKHDMSTLGISEINTLKNEIELMIDREWEEHEEAKEPLMPSRFKYNGVAIIISNDTREALRQKVGDRHWEAITDRFITRDLDPKPQAIWHKIKEELLKQKETDPSILLDEQCMIPRIFVDPFIEKVEELLQYTRYCKMTWRIVSIHMHNIFQGEYGIEDWEDELMQKMDTKL